MRVELATLVDQFDDWIGQHHQSDDGGYGEHEHQPDAPGDCGDHRLMRAFGGLPCQLGYRRRRDRHAEDSDWQVHQRKRVPKG